MTILVTGASGFIGSFIVEEALCRGFDTWAAVRKTSSRKYLKDERIHFLELDFDDEEALTEQLRSHEFDYVVHAAGATKCNKVEDYYRVNTAGTQHLVEALLRLSMPVKKFIFLSSLSVFGAVREEMPYQEIQSTDTPQPNTHYGRSKLMAEQYLRGVTDKLNYTVLRPTGVYGPREKDYFLMVKSLLRHTDCAVGRDPQLLTFVYVTDVVQAVFLALDQRESGKAYFVSDGERYDSRIFSQLVREKLNIKWTIRAALPISIVRLACHIGDFYGRLTGALSALNSDKFHILAQRNWLCDITTTVNELGYNPQVKLHEGVSRAIDWYKQEGWI